MRSTLQIIGLVALALGCAEERERIPCDGDTQARTLAGEDAIDCGVVPDSGDPSTVDACVLGAFRAGQPFVARYDRAGIDSELATLLAFRDGTLFELYYDSSTLGCSDCGSARVSALVCGEPVETSSGSPADAGPPPDGGVSTERIPPLSCATEPERQTLCG